MEKLLYKDHDQNVNTNTSIFLKCKKYKYWLFRHLFPQFIEKKRDIAERSFDLRTSGLWAQHASTAPLCYHSHCEAKVAKASKYFRNKFLIGQKDCQKWDLNPRPQKWTATWTQRLRPLGHPDSWEWVKNLAIRISVCTHNFVHIDITGSLAQLVRASC